MTEQCRNEFSPQSSRGNTPPVPAHPSPQVVWKPWTVCLSLISRDLQALLRAGQSPRPAFSPLISVAGERRCIEASRGCRAEVETEARILLQGLALGLWGQAQRDLGEHVQDLETLSIEKGHQRAHGRGGIRLCSGFQGCPGHTGSTLPWEGW